MMQITRLKIPLWLILLLCLSGCTQEPDAPPQAIDLAVAAQTWNTPEKQWSEAELQQLVKGEHQYRKRCGGCHLSSGEGQLTLGAPALRNSAVVKGPAGELAKTVLFGRGSMPAFRMSLQDAELAQILSFMRNAWGNQQGDVITMADVAAVRAAGK
jgi:cytochrome c oxidase subunit 2